MLSMITAVHSKNGITNKIFFSLKYRTCQFDHYLMTQTYSINLVDEKLVQMFVDLQTILYSNYIKLSFCIW